MNKQPSQDERSEIRALLGLDKARGSRILERRLLVLAGLAVLLLATVGFVFLRSGSGAQQTFVLEPVSRRDITVIVTATGSVQPTNQVDVSSELSGTVRSVFVDFNSPVKVGQVLAELDIDTALKSTERLVSSLDAFHPPTVL